MLAVSRERERVYVGIAAVPFGKGGDSRKIYPKSYRGFDDRRIPEKEYFDEMKRVSKNQIIWGGNYFIAHLENSSCWLVWDKKNDESFFADCELAWTSFSTAVRMFRFRWFGMLQEDMKNKEFRYHPTQKPVELFKWCLEKYTEPNMTILDPFAGSGTTAIAARNLKRNFVLIEKDPEYAKLCRERLAATPNPMF